MHLTDINVLIAILSGVIGIYAGYKKALSEAKGDGESNARIIIMLENLTESYKKMDEKLDTSIEDRHQIREAIGVHDTLITKLLEEVNEIKQNCKDCRKKCD